MAFDLSRNLTKKAIEPRHKLLKSHKNSKKCKGLYLLFTFPSCFIVNIFLKNNKIASYGVYSFNQLFKFYESYFLLLYRLYN